MATVALTTVSVFPTAADVGGGVVGGGARFRELLMAPLWASGASRKYVRSGWDALTGTGLNRTVTQGLAVIDGYCVDGTGQSPTIAFDPSTTNVLWLQLVKSANKVVGVQLVTQNIAAAALADAVRLRHVTTSGSDITSQTDVRAEGRVLFGRLARVSSTWTVGDYGSGDWTHSAGAVTFGTAFRRAPVVQSFFSGFSGGWTVTTSSMTLAGVSGLDDGDEVSFQAML